MSFAMDLAGKMARREPDDFDLCTVGDEYENIQVSFTWVLTAEEIIMLHVIDEGEA